MHTLSSHWPPSENLPMEFSSSSVIQADGRALAGIEIQTANETNNETDVAK